MPEVPKSAAEPSTAPAATRRSAPITSGRRSSRSEGRPIGTGAGITWASDPDAEWAETELKAARATRPQSYIRLNAFDSTRGWETIRLSFIVNRPDHEPGFHLDRIEEQGRIQRYAIRRKSA